MTKQKKLSSIILWFCAVSIVIVFVFVFVIMMMIVTVTVTRNDLITLMFFTEGPRGRSTDHVKKSRYRCTTTPVNDGQFGTSVGR